MPSAELTKADIQLEGYLQYVKENNVHVLNSLPQIAAYLGTSVSTVRRLIPLGLPVINFTLHSGAKQWALRTILDSWLALNGITVVDQGNQRSMIFLRQRSKRFRALTDAEISAVLSQSQAA